jgi:hypothetical protein
MPFAIGAPVARDWRGIIARIAQMAGFAAILKKRIATALA